jgi:hypothetical protein
VTNLTGIAVNLKQLEHDTKIFMNVEALVVKDNSND